MGIGVEVKIKGLDKAKDYVIEKERQVKRHINFGVKDATQEVLKEVKLSIAGRSAEPTSVDTGLFLNTIGFINKGPEGLVFSDLPYAKFLEYGTTKLGPRQHFTNTTARVQQTVNQILKAQLRKV